MLWKMRVFFVAIQLAGFLTQGEAMTYYIAPDSRGTTNHTCFVPNGTLTPCYQLHQILQERLQGSVTLLFLDGVHRLRQHSTFNVSYMESFTVAPLNATPNVEIDCLSSAGFVFMDVGELHVSSMKFVSCNLQYRHNISSFDPPDQNATVSNCEFIGRAHTYSLSFHSVYSVRIENSTFLGSNGAVWCREEEYLHMTKMVITNCTFLDNVRSEITTEMDGPVDPFQPSDGTITITGKNGSALYAEGVNLTMSWCKFINSTSAFGGACYLRRSRVSIMNTIFEGNTAVENGGAMDARFSHVNIRQVTFENNIAHVSGGALYLCANFFKSGLKISGNTTFTFNRAAVDGGAVYCTSSDRADITINDSYFTHNSATNGGALHFVKTYLILQNSVAISNGSASTAGGAIHATDSHLDYGECSTCLMSHNTAGKEGGALYLDTTPLSNGVTKPSTPEVIFHHNTVDSPQGKGGAIFVLDRDCETISSRYHQCFAYNWNFFVPRRKILMFSSNEASYGSVLYGGLLDRCLPPNRLPYRAHQSGIHKFKTIAEYRSTHLAVTSQPMKLCLCSNDISSKTDCKSRFLNVTKMRGEVIRLHLAALDQDENPTSAIIRATYKKVSAALDKGEGSKEITDRCTFFDFHIYTAESEAELTLEPVGPCRQSPLSTFRVYIAMRPCARGFEQKDDRCVCDRRLVDHLNISVCDIDSLSVKPKGSAWLRYDDEYLKLSRNCPFDYCSLSTASNINISSPDEQCSNHRSGILCGSCQDNHSIALGTTKCLQCTLTTVWLLAAFCIAGIALVALLLVCNLTLSKGTLNGIIFYANVISISGLTNLYTFPIHPILSIFIAWLNLDLGIETCFYTGLDMYQKTWLQFCFPLYIWLLVAAIIVASYFSSRAMKVFGRNNIAVLATLFLLSYNKILKTIITSLTFTDVLVSSAGNITDRVALKRVWTYDGNLNYLQGKHIPLFVVSVLSLTMLFIPYTMLLTFGQCLRSMRVGRRKLPCTRNIAFISIMDAYHAPYRRTHRYWTGLMLITRCLLFLAFATYEQDRVLVTNMFAITLVVMCILAIKMYATNIYKQPTVNTLEVVSLLNLGIMSATLYYLKGKDGSTDSMCKVITASISISFVTFLGILAYHAYLRIKKEKCYLFIDNKFREMFKTKTRPGVSSGDKKVPLVPSNNFPTHTIVELRESLLI